MTQLFSSQPFIVAEIGSNWQDLGQCISSISLAKQCGADAVKFQAFDYESLYGVACPSTRTDEYGGVYYCDKFCDQPVCKSKLPLDWLPKLQEKAKACGVEFMCTAFSPELVEAIDPFVEVHKVASGDLAYPQLLKAIAKTGKPVLLSTGASSKLDVTMAVKTLQDGGAGKIVLLYCNAGYPSVHHNLYQMTWMAKEWRLPVGLSDHSIDAVYCPLSAVRQFGAVVIEKHFTAFPDLDSPDQPHSLTSDDFKIMCDHIRGNNATDEFNPSRDEKMMFMRANRRLVATQDLSEGDTLAYGVNYGAYRTLEDDTKGLSPFMWDNKEYGPEGKTVIGQIARGMGIGTGDFK